MRYFSLALSIVAGCVCILLAYVLSEFSIWIVTHDGVCLLMDREGGSSKLLHDLAEILIQTRWYPALIVVLPFWLFEAAIFIERKKTASRTADDESSIKS